MRNLFILAALFAGVFLFAQDKPTGPNVTVQKMSDAEYKNLDDASLSMQKAAEAYLKAADEYAKLKSSILSKYGATDEGTHCSSYGSSTGGSYGWQKIVDLRGQFIIVETRENGIGNPFSCGVSAIFTPATTLVNR